MKDTDGDLEDFVMISSLACVANGSEDDGRSIENSRPKSCETLIPVPSPSSISSMLWSPSPLIAGRPGRIARPRGSVCQVDVLPPAGGEIFEGSAGWIVEAVCEGADGRDLRDATF
jgi:hypothetical protein